MTRHGEGATVVSVILGLLLLIALAVSQCGRTSGPQACRNSVRVLSWLHMDDATCPHADHNLSVERVGLKAIMRCTCRAGRDSFESAKLTTGEFNEP